MEETVAIELPVYVAKEIMGWIDEEEPRKRVSTHGFGARYWAMRKTGDAIRQALIERSEEGERRS